MTEGQSVLVIEDEDDIREGVICWLDHQGFTTLNAKDGAAGIEIARADKPNLILLDVLMPKMGGLDTLARLRADCETANIPVVMLSASLRDEQRTLDAGARYFVHKPFDGRRLVATVRSALRNPAAAY